MKRLILAIAFAAFVAAPIAEAAETTRRSGVGRTTHRRPHFGYRRFRTSFGWGWGWGWGYSPYWYGPYHPYGGYYGRYGYGRAVSGEWAVVDTDVSPESAAVYLDGQYVGTADDFDGYPDYLYLRSGRYRLEFRLEGYENRAITVDARPGVKIDVGDRLAKIPGAPRYGSYDAPDHGGAVRRFWGKRRDVAEHVTDEEAIYGRDDRRYRERPRYRADSEREERYAEEPDADVEVERRPNEDWRGRAGPMRGEARLRLDVAPSDAAVYVDDRFMGTAQSLESDGIPISAGRHTIVVSRPGYRDRRVEVDLSRGETERVEINLEK